MKGWNSRPEVTIDFLSFRLRPLKAPPGFFRFPEPTSAAVARNRFNYIFNQLSFPSQTRYGIRVRILCSVYKYARALKYYT